MKPSKADGGGAPEVSTDGASSVFTIYCHTHIESGRRYIGLTSRSMMKRWKDHVSKAKYSKGGRWHFPNAIRKYGKEAFVHEVLEVCNTLELANAAEDKWIEFYDTRNPEKGFNLDKGGSHTPHPNKNPWNRPEYREANLASSRRRLAKATEVSALNKVQSRPEVRQKLSEVMKRVAATPEGRAQRELAAHRGKVLTEEHRAKISENNATKRPEVLAKMSTGIKAAWADPEKRARMTLPHIGKKSSPETLAKTSASLKAAWADPEKRAHMTLSDEIRKKIGESQRHTHCKRGHAMEGHNVMVSGNKRRCRACINMRGREWWSRKQKIKKQEVQETQD
jgi:group I intron endonuclease